MWLGLHRIEAYHRCGATWRTRSVGIYRNILDSNEILTHQITVDKLNDAQNIFGYIRQAPPKLVTVNESGDIEYVSLAPVNLSFSSEFLSAFKSAHPGSHIPEMSLEGLVSTISVLLIGRPSHAYKHHIRDVAACLETADLPDSENRLNQLLVLPMSKQTGEMVSIGTLPIYAIIDAAKKPEGYVEFLNVLSEDKTLIYIKSLFFDTLKRIFPRTRVFPVFDDDQDYIYYFQTLLIQMHQRKNEG